MTNNETNKTRRLEHRIGLIVLILLLIGAILVLRPFLSALIFAAILSFSLWPLHCRLAGWIEKRPLHFFARKAKKEKRRMGHFPEHCNLAALITTIFITLVLVVPFVVLGFNLADDLRALGGAAVKWIETDPQPPSWLDKMPLVGPPAKRYWQEFAEGAAQLAIRLGADPNIPADDAAAVPQSKEESRLINALAGLIKSARTWLLAAAVAIVHGLIQILLSVLLTFFLLRDITIAERLMAGVNRIAGERGIYLLKVAGGTIRSVVYGIIGTALAQGITAGIGFTIAGVPGAAFLGLVTFFFSPIPIGPPLIWIPAAIWLFAQGRPGWGTFMLIWGIAISSVDNIVKPWIISYGSRMPFIVIFLGVIGGALAFGFIGVFLGPVLLAMIYCLLNEWLGGKKMRPEVNFKQ